MSALDTLRAKWEQMDEIDRKNFYFALVGLLVIIVALITVSNALGSVGNLLGLGADYASDSVDNIGSLPLGNR